MSNSLLPQHQNVGLRYRVVATIADHYVTLVAHVDCYEIRAIKQDSLHDLCSYMLSSVLSIMKEINDVIVPIITFVCKCSHLQSPSYSHLCKLSPGVNTCFKCNLTVIKFLYHLIKNPGLQR